MSDKYRKRRKGQMQGKNIAKRRVRNRIELGTKDIKPRKMEWAEKYKDKVPKPAGKAASRVKKAGVKAIAKRVAKGAVKRTPVGAGAIVGWEAAKGVKKIGKSLKARAACKKKGGVYKGGFCVTSKSIKKKVLGK